MIPRSLVLLALALSPTFCVEAEEVAIRVDATKRHQVYEGFGATTLGLVYEGSLGDSLGPTLRPKVLDALYRQVGLSMGNLSVGLLESPGGFDQRRNDNDDPDKINWQGFNTFQADQMWQKVVQPAAAMGLDNYSLEGKINWRWSSPWLAELYKKDRKRCLEECAEQVEACVRYWRKVSGTVPRLVHLFNEPTSGNGEIAGADAAMVRDIVKSAGDRLRRAGFKEVKFVVPNEETVRRSIEVARVILADPEARQYVAAIGYHVYPYGSPYASVPRVLHASGAGRPDAESIRERSELRKLCASYGVPAWMTEVSHGEVDPRSLDHLRGRAIHIHDEMVYTDAAAFYGMNAMWDRKSHADHFRGRGGEGKDAYLSEQDTIVLANNETGEVLITGMGYAIGHYARWLKRGAVRVEATSSDPLVQVTAFHDSKAQRAVLVVVNNAPESRGLDVVIPGLKLSGSVEGEQSREHVRWEKLAEFATKSADRFRASLPALSVATLAVTAKAEHALPNLQEVKAQSADAFVDSIGVNVHLAYLDTAYREYEKVIRPRLEELGVRHIRDGCPPPWNTEHVRRLNDLAKVGVRSLLICSPHSGSLDEVLATLKKLAKSVEAVEGPNEPDQSKFSYKGQGFPEGTREYQDALYRAVKQDKANAQLPVIMTSMSDPNSAPKLGLLTSADYANTHSYADGGPPGFRWDWYMERATTNCKRPVIATETGYHNAPDRTDGLWIPGVSEAASGKYLLRLLPEYFRRGVVRTYLYEFLNLRDNPVHSESNFGLLRADGQPKPAFTAIKNLIKLLRDPGPEFSPGSLPFELSGNPDRVNQLLLQKRDGRFYLLLWVNAVSSDTKAKRDLNVPEQQVTVQFDRPMKAIRSYLPFQGVDSVVHDSRVEELSVSAPDHVLVLEIEP